MASTLDETLTHGLRTAFGQDEEQVSAGLALLGRDYYLYLKTQESAREDAAWFMEAVEAVRKDEEETFGDWSYPDYKAQIERGDLPEVLAGTRLAEAAARGQPTIHPLLQNLVVQEWTKFPGTKLFDKIQASIGPHLKGAICSEIGPGRILNANTLPIAVPLVANGLAGAGIAIGGAASGFWMPVVAYLCLVAAKRGLDVYCATGDAPPP
jgi:hypothetical protein